MYANHPTDRSLTVPVQHRDLRVVANRVVEIETKQVDEAVWLAVGLISDPLPTGRRLRAPIELIESGCTEHEALSNLEHRIASL